MPKNYSRSSRPLATRIVKLTDRHAINSSLGSHLREFRESRGISQHDLGTSIGLPDDIAQQHIYKYEKGVIRIPFDIAVKIAKALNVDIIINGDNMILVPR